MINPQTKKYALAGFNVALSYQATDKWCLFLEDLTLIVTEDSIKNLMNLHLLDTLQDIFATLFQDKDYFDQKMLNFITLVLEQNILFQAADILREFKHLKDTYQDTVNVDVISAVKLNSHQIVNLTAIVQKKLEKNITLNNSVDSHLLTGFVIKTDEFVIDMSGAKSITTLTKN